MEEDQVKKTLDKCSLGWGSMMAMATLPLMMNIMFGGNKMFGNDKPDRRQLAHGMLDLIFDNYEAEINKNKDEQLELYDKIDKLEKENEELKKKLEKKK